jgi:hypothetical protein
MPKRIKEPFLQASRFQTPLQGAPAREENMKKTGQKSWSLDKIHGLIWKRANFMLRKLSTSDFSCLYVIFTSSEPSAGSQHKKVCTCRRLRKPLLTRFRLYTPTPANLPKCQRSLLVVLPRLFTCSRVRMRSLLPHPAT